MRQVLLATTVLLAACHLENGDNAILNSVTEAEDGSIAGKVAKAARRPVDDADAPVASDDPMPSPASDDGPSPDCRISSSSDWHAHVDAMPGPDASPNLIVSGKVTVPSGAYKLALLMGAVAESYPVQVTVHLDAVPPSRTATQALETHEVRGSWRSEERVGSVTVRCGSRVVARLSNIETAR